MQVHLEGQRSLRFDDGTPVRSASALAPFGTGRLVAQDDATHAAWLVDGHIRPLRLFDAVDGLDEFSEAAGTKHLKPDLEAASPVQVDGRAGVLLFGSGSTPARRRAALVLDEADPTVQVADLGPLYDAIAGALGLADDQLNLEGVARNRGVLRLFQRGNLGGGVPNASIDVDLFALLEAVRGRRDPDDVPLRAPRVYELGQLHGVGLAATDAVALPDGSVLLSAAAEDTPNAVDDGPVVASALARLDGDQVRAIAPLPVVAGVVPKVEGLGVIALLPGGVRLAAVVDSDNPLDASMELTLRVDLVH